MNIHQIELNHGECLHLALKYTQEDGSPMDITGCTLDVMEASTTITAEFDITDASGGAATLTIADTGALALGRIDWMRLRLTRPDGCADTTPPIWFKVA